MSSKLEYKSTASAAREEAEMMLAVPYHEVREGKVYNEYGEVAILVSTGYGAGWSTWNDTPVGHTPLEFSEPIVLALLNGKIALPEELDEYYGITEDDDDSPYLYYNGTLDCEIVWVRPGTPYRIVEYDGAETIEINPTMSMA